MEIWEERHVVSLILGVGRTTIYQRGQLLTQMQSPPGNQGDSMEYDCEDDPFAHISQELIFEDEI